MTDNLPAVIANPPASVEEPRRQDPIYDALRVVGVHTLRVRYSGSGDSGSIDEVEALDRDGHLIKLPHTPVPYTFTHTTYDFKTGSYETETTDTNELPLSEAVEQWCYDLLEEHFPGWENDGGADGTIIIDPSQVAGHIEHTSYFTKSYSERRSFS